MKMYLPCRLLALMSLVLVWPHLGFADGKSPELDVSIYERLAARSLVFKESLYMKSGDEGKEIIEKSLYHDAFSYWIFTSKFKQPRSKVVEVRMGSLCAFLLKSKYFMDFVTKRPAAFNQHGRFVGLRYGATTKEGEKLVYEVTELEQFRKMNKEFLDFLKSCQKSYLQR